MQVVRPGSHGSALGDRAVGDRRLTEDDAHRRTIRLREVEVTDRIDEAAVDRLLPDPRAIEAAAERAVDVTGEAIVSGHIPIDARLVGGIPPAQTDDGQTACDGGIRDQRVEQLVFVPIIVDVAQNDDAVRPHRLDERWQGGNAVHHRPAVGPGVGVTVSHAARTAASPNIPSHERIGIEYPARRVPVPVTRRTTKRRVPVAALASMAR